jgi:hypothetical protein
MGDEEILKAARVVADAVRVANAAHQVEDDARRRLHIAEQESCAANRCVIEAREALWNLLSAGTPDRSLELADFSVAGGIVLPQGWSSNPPAPQPHVVEGK